MSPHFFIDRPIFASVLSIVIVVVGLVSLQALPVAQFPQITPPMVQIDADYPGASAEVVADAVARPIEVQLPGIDNLMYYDSTSTNDGHMTMRLTFEIGTDIDIAQVQALSTVRDESAINPGNAKNRLELRCAGAKISAVVNGKVLASVDDMTLNRGDHGVGVGAFTGIQGTLEARYDNLEIRAP